jgi:hypothetical protein
MQEIYCVEFGVVLEAMQRMQATLDALEKSPAVVQHLN